MNINEVDPSVMEELVNRYGKRKPQPLTNMDFRLIDAIHFPLDHIRTGRELGARGRKGNADLRREGILSLKGIYASLSNKLKPSNNTVGTLPREYFP